MWGDEKRGTMKEWYNNVCSLRETAVAAQALPHGWVDVCIFKMTVYLIYV